MNDADLTEKISDMFRLSRASAGKSQEYMAKALHVSKRTIQNWENGSCVPNIISTYNWFNVLCIPPQPYFLNLLYPDIDNRNFNNSKKNENIKSDLIRIISDMPPNILYELHFILSGTYGSSPATQIDSMAANLQTPPSDQLKVLQNVITNYQIAESLGNLTDESAVRPSVNNMKEIFQRAMTAVLQRRKE